MKKILMFISTAILSLGSAYANNSNYLGYIAKKSTDNTPWSWSSTNKLPVLKWNTISPGQNIDNSYSRFGKLNAVKSILVVGNKTTPITVSFHSSVGSDDDDKLLWQINDLVNKNDITLIQTNCSEIKNTTTGEEKAFYHWHKQGFRPMFLKKETSMSAKGEMTRDIDFSFSINNLCTG